MRWGGGKKIIFFRRNWNFFLMNFLVFLGSSKKVNLSTPITSQTHEIKKTMSNFSSSSTEFSCFICWIWSKGQRQLLFLAVTEVNVQWIFGLKFHRAEDTLKWPSWPFNTSLQMVLHKNVQMNDILIKEKSTKRAGLFGNWADQYRHSCRMGALSLGWSWNINIKNKRKWRRKDL